MNEQQQTLFGWRVTGIRRYQPPNRISRSMVAAAPWVNAVLLILMFVILNSPFVLQPGVIIDLPEAPFAAGTRYGHVIVVLSQESPDSATRKELVFFADERFILNNDGQGEKLKDAIAAAVRRHPDSAMVIEADKRVEYGTIIKILNMAKSAGVKEVNIAARPATPARGS